MADGVAHEMTGVFDTKSATSEVSPFIVTVQVFPDDEVHPFQDRNVPAGAEPVRTTLVPGANLAVQAVPQLIALSAVVTVPPPTVDTVRPTSVSIVLASVV